MATNWTVSQDHIGAHRKFNISCYQRKNAQDWKQNVKAQFTAFISFSNVLLQILLRRRNDRNGRFQRFFIHQKKEIQFITLQKFTIKELLQRITSSMCANKAKICMRFVDSFSARVKTKSPIEDKCVFFSSCFCCNSTKSFFEHWNPPIWKLNKICCMRNILRKFKWTRKKQLASTKRNSIPNAIQFDRQNEKTVHFSNDKHEQERQGFKSGYKTYSWMQTWIPMKIALKRTSILKVRRFYSPVTKRTDTRTCACHVCELVFSLSLSLSCSLFLFNISNFSLVFPCITSTEYWVLRC